MRLSLSGFVAGASPPPNGRLERTLTAGAAALTAGAVLSQSHTLRWPFIAPVHTAVRRQPSADPRPSSSSSSARSSSRRRSKPKLNWLAVDAISGAVGEIASMVVLFPLDTLKVMCQARGASAGTVLRELCAMGLNARTIRTLYAGCGSSAVCSAAIGSVYLLAFYSLKRLGTQLALQQQRQQQQHAAVTAAQSSGGSSQGQQEGTHPLVASMAGVGASLVGSVFEAPMESFKLRAQAGHLHGPMLSSMLASATQQGIGSLYATYVGFVIKSIPFDVAELFTYSQLCDFRAAAAARRERRAQLAAGSAGTSGSMTSSSSSSSRWQEQLGDMLARAPDTTSDLLIGAAAGAASVLVSMPFDVVKTRLDLQHCGAAAAGAAAAGGGGPGSALRSLRTFCLTGQQLMAQGGGPQALFVGLWPRLLQTLPSTMVYWASVEACRRALTTCFDVEGSSESAPASSITSSSIINGSLPSSRSGISTGSLQAGSSIMGGGGELLQLAAAPGAAPAGPAVGSSSTGLS